MSTKQKSIPVPLKYHENAYRFLDMALRFTQQQLGRTRAHGPEDEASHISGQELLDGIRSYAKQQFGLLTVAVFHDWGIHSTDDFGRMVFELIERGEMHKTANDHLHDFCDRYDFEDAFDRDYKFDLKHAFSN